MIYLTNTIFSLLLTETSILTRFFTMISILLWFIFSNMLSKKRSDFLNSLNSIDSCWILSSLKLITFYVHISLKSWTKHLLNEINSRKRFVIIERMDWLSSIVYLKLRLNKYRAEKQRTRCLFIIKWAIIQIKTNAFDI